jgi:hypothetical protein
MEADLDSVEQLNGLLHTVQESEAAGMDLSSGKNAALATGSASSSAHLVPGQNDGAADMQANGCGEFSIGNQRKAQACRAICHTLPQAEPLAGAVNCDGGEGIERERGPALYNPLGRSKFISIAPPAAKARTASVTCKNRPQKKEGAASVKVVVVGAASVAAWSKSLLGREKRSGAICAVRLTRHGAKATQFTTGQVLSCTPTGPHEFEYEGGKAA